MRRILALLVGVAIVVIPGCGSDEDELRPVSSADLSPRLQEAERKLTKAGFDVEGGDLEVYGVEAERVLLVNRDTDSAFIVYERGILADVRPPRAVVDVRVSVGCGGLTMAGPGSALLNDAVKKGGLCRGHSS